MRKVLPLAMLVAMATTAVGNEIRFGREQFVAAPLVNYTGSVSLNYNFTVTAGDGQFLVTWVDTRGENPAVLDPFGATVALAMRVDAAGHVLDPNPIPLPFRPAHVIWTGTEWLLLNSSAVRLDREGHMIGGPVPLFDGVGGAPNPNEEMPAVWTGRALIVAASDWYGNRLFVRSFTPQLELVEQNVLLENDDQGGDIIGAATDGVTAMIAWRHLFWSMEPTQTATFDLDGHLLKTGTLLQGAIYAAIAGSTSGYAAVGPDTFNGPTYHGIIVNSDGSYRSFVDTFAMPTHTPFSFERPLVWDGSQFLLLKYGYDDKGVSHLSTTRFDTQGHIVEPTTDVRTWSYPGLPREPKFARMGTTVAMANVARTVYGPIWYPLDVRVAPSIDALFNAQPAAIPPGAVPRETPAAVSSAAQVLAAWRQRTTPTGPQDVFATRLSLEGTPVDGVATQLGSETCPGIAPALASDGHDFLAAWTSQGDVLASLVNADGSVAKGLRLGRFLTCTTNGVSVASNGSQYFVAWSSADVGGPLRVHGVRIAADGTLLDKSPLDLGLTRTQTATTTLVRAASDGTDYLVAWEGFATRVRASNGAVVDRSTPISFANGDVDGLWFNGQTYIVAVRASGYRFYRVKSDGTGGHAWNSTDPPLQAVPGLPYNGRLKNLTCDRNRCFMILGSTVLRVEDDGDAFTFAVDTSNLNDQAMTSPALVIGRGLIALYSHVEFDPPYSNAPAILTRAVAEGKQRAVRR